MHTSIWLYIYVFIDSVTNRIKHVHTYPTHGYAMCMFIDTYMCVYV